MADYSVNLQVAIDGAEKLKNLRSETNALGKDIRKFNREVNKTMGRKKGEGSLVYSFSNLSKEVSNARSKLNQAAIDTDQFNDAVKNLVKVETEYGQELKKRQRAIQIATIAEKDGITIDQARIKLIKQETEAEARLAAQKVKTANAQARKRIGSTISSAAIGGAFPLLFGQTGAAAVGGGLGGAAGGLIGGQFGFALSIVGTAIGSFIQQQDELDKSLLKISRSFENAGSTVGFTRESFNELKSTLGMTKDEILSIATAFSRFGEAGASAAFIFGDNPNTFKNLAAMRDTKTLMTAILDEQNGLNIEQQIQLLREAKLTSFKDMQLKLNRLILEENLKREIIEAEQITRQEKISDIFKSQLRTIMLIKSFGTMDLKKTFPDFFKTSAEKNEEDVAKLRERFEELTNKLPELQDLLTELDTQVQGMSYSIPSALDSVTEELRKLMSVGYMVTTVAETIGDSFGESFKGIVKGTMTAQQALANLFQRTADAFLDMAAQMIAKQIQMKILGIGLNFFGGGLGGSGGGKVIDSNAVPLVDPLTGIGTAANGGPIPGRKPTLVGERGPELFTPGVSGYVTPNHELGGSSTNIVVNVDASGSSVEGDEQQSRELGQLISVAIQSELIKQKRPGGLLG